MENGWSVSTHACREMGNKRVFRLCSVRGDTKNILSSQFVWPRSGARNLANDWSDFYPFGAYRVRYPGEKAHPYPDHALRTFRCGRVWVFLLTLSELDTFCSVCVCRLYILWAYSHTAKLLGVCVCVFVLASIRFMAKLYRKCMQILYTATGYQKRQRRNWGQRRTDTESKTWKGSITKWTEGSNKHEYIEYSWAST